MRTTALAWSLLLSGSLFAADGSSGCGAGWYILKDNSLVSSYLRQITNVMFSSTFGMTFGTSNCAKHSIVEQEQKAVHFVENNYPQLIKDLAKGESEMTAAMAFAMGCEWQSYPAFAKAVSENYEYIVPKQESPEGLVAGLRMVVASDADLRGQCGYRS